ncbi:MAG TPA: ATP-binding protein, partial [Elusimicrobiales bacterium]|nr:ATP-binding protein [Elusimicrobiales bacterium]
QGILVRELVNFTSCNMTIKLPKILCIDGKDKNLEPLKDFLNEQGFETIFPEPSADFFDVAQHHLPDVVLIDITLSYTDGLNFLKKIRLSKKTRHMPVMVIIPHGGTVQKKRALDLECDDFLSVPVDSEDLASRIKLLMKLSHYRKQLNNQEKFEAVVSQMNDGIVICDIDWAFQRINSAGSKQLNLSGSVPVNIADYIYKNYTVSIGKENLLASKETTLHFDITRQETENTKTLFLEATRNLITSLGGEVTGILLTLRDVTDKRKEEMLKQNFLSFISHKLRTPLTVLFARCDLIRSGIFGVLNKKQLEEVNSLLVEIRHLRTLFNKLLNFVEHQKDSVEVVDLPKYLDLLFRRFVNIYPYRKIEVKTDIKPENVKVLMSKRKINDIFENLTDNAVKFNNNERVSITVSANATSDGFVNVSFSDNGSGIPSEEHDKIFDKFYQVEKNFTGEMEGVGIGLSHVKKIIEDSGGTIKVDSQIDKGTTFMFRLPLIKKNN